MNSLLCVWSPTMHSGRSALRGRPCSDGAVGGRRHPHKRMTPHRAPSYELAMALRCFDVGVSALNRAIERLPTVVEPEERRRDFIERLRVAASRYTLEHVPHSEVQGITLNDGILAIVCVVLEGPHEGRQVGLRGRLPVRPVGSEQLHAYSRAIGIGAFDFDNIEPETRLAIELIEDDGKLHVGRIFPPRRSS